MDISIRLATEDELDEILEVERLASQRFNAYDLFVNRGSIAESEAEKETEAQDFGEEHREGITHKQLWVATTKEYRIVGFALAQSIDEEGHLREIDVLQNYGRKGIGRKLIQTVIQWCILAGYSSLTLTTFRDIPFNGPYYKKLGFEIIEPESLTGTLKQMIIEEQARFKMERVAMRKYLPDPLL